MLRNPGLAAGAVPSLARAISEGPGPTVPGAIRSRKISCSRSRCFLPFARHDQTATARPGLKLELLDSKLTFKMSTIHDWFIAAGY